MILSQVFPKLDKENKKMDASGKKKFASQIMKAVKGHRKLGQKGFLLWRARLPLATATAARVRPSVITTTTGAGNTDDKSPGGPANTITVIRE